ncbi:MULTISPECIES: hypothetical protein [Burkholderiaceae]|uniref:hypothetical protein n=1 Tax=Burkholderiaceae TaxID=119060 RepID=UPI001420FEB1|nr:MULTISPECIES: hypothetical protein [Burkholderiaceae]NIF56019.1 hypothetical protein [Burkholderia sp. Ax-1724]NIF81127.1 hypothetical protein [Paraburkholderia sp. Cy-641]
MSIDKRHHLLHPRTRFALAHTIQAVGDWLFDGLAWTSAACHLANSIGFSADEELVERYLAMPGWNDEQSPARTHQDNSRGKAS